MSEGMQTFERIPENPGVEKETGVEDVARRIDALIDALPESLNYLDDSSPESARPVNTEEAQALAARQLAESIAQLKEGLLDHFGDRTITRSEHEQLQFTARLETLSKALQEAYGAAADITNHTPEDGRRTAQDIVVKIMDALAHIGREYDTPST